MTIDLACGQHSLLPSDIIDFAMLPAQRARAVGKKFQRYINNREFKFHVYCKRQTSDSSWEFLKIENEQIITAQNNLYG